VVSVPRLPLSGLPALGLVAAALASHPRRWRGFLALLGLSAGLFALGRYTPVHGAALAVLPFLKILRYPSKAMVFVALSWALLAGMGHDACRAPGDAPGSGGPSWLASRRARLGVLAPMAVVVALGWAGTLLAFHGAETLGRLLSSVPPAPDTFGLDVRPTAFKLLVSTGLATVVLLFLLGGRTGRWARRCARAAALVAVVDLVAAHWNANATTRKEFFTYRPDILKVFPPGGLTRLHVWDYVMRVPGREPAGPSRLPMFYEVPQGWPPRVGGAMAMQMYLYPPSAARWGLSGSYDPDLLDLGGRTFYDLNLLVRSVEGTPVYTKLLRMGAVDYVVTLHDEGLEGLERIAVIPGLYSEPIRVFRVPDPLPRAYAVGTTRIAEGAAALQALLDESFDPKKELILGSGRPARAGPGFAATCRLIEVKPDRVRVEAELSEPGYVVLVEGREPGWSATVDGAAAEILPANVAFRAVAVPAGRHQVEYVYRPTAVIAGLLCSGITLLLVVVGLARAGKAGGLV
jgi:hypothetical protein